MMILKDLLLCTKNNVSPKQYFQKFSPYLDGLITQHHDWLVDNQLYNFDDLLTHFTQSLDTSILTTSQEELMTLMRLIKGRSSLVIALYDVFGNLHVKDITNMLSKIADLLIKNAFKAGCIEWIKRGKLPLTLDSLEEGSGLIIVAMGKLGAMELNFSSDVDICVFFDPYAVLGVDEHQLYDGFIRATKSAVKILSERTQYGYVYRVDLRLRPDPASTKVAVPIQAAEYYYERSGQNWERAAWIKGRFVYGDPLSWIKLKELLRPFIWRRNLDFATIQDIHSIKRQIHSHYGHDEIKVYGHDVKLGKGGIREIELFVQTQQLIGGGRDIRLRTQATLDILEILVEKQWLDYDVAQKLNNAYCLFRKVEHRLQMVNDAQTHEIPIAGDAFNSIALFCDFKTSQDFIETMMHAMTDVNHAYKQLFEHHQTLSSSKGSLVFSGIDYHPDTVVHLKNMGFENPKTAIDIIANWHKGHYRAMRSAKSREILTELTPLLLEKISHSNTPDKTLLRLDHFLERLPTGVAFFSYLMNSPPLMDLLLDIMALAPNLADFLSHYPSTFDAMTDVSFFVPPTSQADFEQELTYQIRPDQSKDRLLDIIRRFNREQKFRIGVLVLRNLMTPRDASISFTILAHICISHVTHIIEAEMRHKHNLTYKPNDINSLCIVGMGSVGAYEMTASSDLDLMMIYEPDDYFNQHNIDAETYYTKLGKRILTALTVSTPEGFLYDVDMRLRPSGNSGPLVIHYQRFIDYQTTETHTWEQCALTKLYPICGHITLQTKIRQKTQEIIKTHRDKDTLRNDIHAMRLKLLTARPPVNFWDIKLIKGGLFDINFIVQYLILSADDTVSEKIFSGTLDNLTILNRYNLLSDSYYNDITHAWDIYHTLLHIFSIAKLDIKTMDTTSKKIKERICHILNIADFNQAEHCLGEQYKKISMIYDDFLNIARNYSKLR
jgi:[glutamine synthetase] adenylyltransferase / [glutamine synthetase]-adenylyl-L-tyrosine phosphorylase